jgi:hypothetical protein
VLFEWLSVVRRNEARDAALLGFGKF